MFPSAAQFSAATTSTIKVAEDEYDSRNLESRINETKAHTSNTVGNNSRKKTIFTMSTESSTSRKARKCSIDDRPSQTSIESGEWFINEKLGSCLRFPLALPLIDLLADDMEGGQNGEMKKKKLKMIVHY
jgi:hypothetical protein